MKTLTRSDLGGMTCSATFSDCDAYRYDLTWRWSDQPLIVAWMLNPSTGTHEKLDPTIRGLVTRAKLWAHGGVRVINLFAYRSTAPAAMKRAADPVGPENDRITREVLEAASEAGDTILCAWGCHGRFNGQDRAALAIARNVGAHLHSLGVNADETPRHPLYISHHVAPERWWGPE